MSGRIDFGPDPPRLIEPDVHVWIEDTTYADAPAVRVAERRLTGASYDGGADGLPFTIEWDDRRRSPGRTYTIAAFVDVDRDGRPGPGDFVTTQAVRVPEPDVRVSVRVKRVGG